MSAEGNNRHKGCSSWNCVIDPPRELGTNSHCKCSPWKLQAEIRRLKFENSSLEFERDSYKCGAGVFSAEIVRLRSVLKRALPFLRLIYSKALLSKVSEGEETRKECQSIIDEIEKLP